MAHACCVSPFSAQNPSAQYSSGLPGINAQHSALSRLHDQPPGLRGPRAAGGARGAGPAASGGRSGRAPGLRCGATRSSLGHLTANGCCAGGDGSSPLRAGPGAPHGRLSPGLPLGHCEAGQSRYPRAWALPPRPPGGPWGPGGGMWAGHGWARSPRLPRGPRPGLARSGPAFRAPRAGLASLATAP